MNESQFRHLLDKYLQGKCAPEEIRLLHQFYDSFQEGDWNTDLKDITDSPQGLSRRKSIHQGIRQRINTYDNQPQSPRKPVSASFRGWFTAAAVILLMVTIGIATYVGEQETPEPATAWIEKSTRKGQMATITLTDGTKVYLSVDSKISFPEQFDSNRREIQLEGEAFFDVARDVNRPFTIRSGDLLTTVLGTSFNIKAFPHEPMHVTVASGKVKVQSADQETASSVVFLAPNQQAFYDGQLSTREVDVSSVIFWREKTLQFDEASLEEVATVLERWFNVSITIENEQLRPCTISGRYVDENLINIMKSLEHILGIEYQMQEQGKVIINGERCKSQK